MVNEQPSGPVNDRVRVMSLNSMNSWFANRYTEIVGSDGKVRPVTWAKAWHSHRDRRQYDGVEFFPNPDGAPGTPNYLNLWRGFDVTPSPAGSYHVFRDHLLTNVCAAKNLFKYLFGWMAHIVQKPRERLGTAIVLRGRRGTGKSKVGEVLGSLFSSHYFQVDEARYRHGQFNPHMASCLLLQADEAMWAGDKAAEGRLKGLITSGNADDRIKGRRSDPDGQFRARHHDIQRGLGCAGRGMSVDFAFSMSGRGARKITITLPRWMRNWTTAAGSVSCTICSPSILAKSICGTLRRRARC